MTNTSGQSALSAVQQLFVDYAWAIDTRDWALLERKLESNVDFAIAVTGSEPLGPIVGREPVLAAIRDSVNAQTDRRRHVITNVRLDEGTTSATAVLTLLVVENGQAGVKTCGHYRARVVETAEGHRFTSLHLTLDLAY